MAVHEPGSQLSPNTESAGTLILEFPAPELCEINICCLSHQSGVIVVAAHTKTASMIGECFTYYVFGATIHSSMKFLRDGGYMHRLGILYL